MAIFLNNVPLVLEQLFPQLLDPCTPTLSDGSSRGAFCVLQWVQWGQFCGAVAQVSANL